MNKLLLFLLCTFVFSSCTFTEEITINPDGTGKYNLDMDGSGIMAMMPRDSLKNEKSIDSVFSFKQLFEAKKDSISKLSKEEQAKIKKLENFNMRMKMNYADKQFLFSINTDFKNINELQEGMSGMKMLRDINKNDASFKNALGGKEDFGNNKSSVNYFYDGKKFSRVAVLDKVNIKDRVIADDSLDSGFQMIYASSKYIIKYHFPKAVKKVSNSSALFSEDRKTITIEYPFNEYIKEPEKLNFEVVFQ